MSEWLAQYAQVSRGVTDDVRWAAAAGIAVAWALDGESLLSAPLPQAGLALLVFSLFLDFLQFFVQTVSLRRMLFKGSYDPDRRVSAPWAVKNLAYYLWWIKCVSLIGGFIFIGTRVVQRAAV